MRIVGKRLLTAALTSLLLGLTVPVSPAFSADIVLKTAGHEAYPKFFKLNDQQDAPVQGLAVDIMEAIEQENPAIEFELSQRLVPWRRLQAQLETGQVDIFFGLVRNAAREQKYNFIDTPLYRLKHVVAVRSDDNIEINSFEEIQELGESGVILTMHGSGTVNYMRGKNPNLIIDQSTRGVLSGLRMLSQGRGRFYYYHDLGVHSGIRRMGLDDQIKVLPAVFRNYDQWAAFAPTVPKSTQVIVSRTVETLAEDGTLARLFRTYVPSS